MKKLVVILFIVVFTTGLFAEGWNTEGAASITANQQAYSENWSGGEKSALSWVFDANFMAEKQLIPILHNKNTLKLAFGQTHNQILDLNGDKQWDKPEKSTDVIDFESMFRFTLGSFVDPFASARLESQFIDESGEETEIFNPNITTEAVGVAKVFMKSDVSEFSSRLGAAFKQYFDTNADNSTNDGGIELVALYKTPLSKGMIDFNSNLNLYKPLFYSESDSEEYELMYEDGDWEMVRMDWQNDLNIKLHSLVNLKFFLQLKYNLMEDEDMQIKETMGVGISYRLF